MGRGKSKILKILAWVVIAAGVVGLSFIIVPEFGGLKYRLHAGDESSPTYLTDWMVRAVSDDYPDSVWNAMNMAYRGLFTQHFDKVRKGEVPTVAWEKAGADTGLASSAGKLSKLDDRKMFRVWWALNDRSAVGFRIPAFLNLGGAKPTELVFDKVFYDQRKPEEAGEGYLLYKINGVADLLHFGRENGRWRLDVPKDVPEGM